MHVFVAILRMLTLTDLTPLAGVCDTIRDILDYPVGTQEQAEGSR